MKSNLQKLFTLSIAMIGLCLTSNAQSSASATATATATIIAPITITKTADLNFGNVSSGTGAGTVTLSTAGVRTGTAAAPTVGTVSAAAFDITGEDGASFAVTLPAGPYAIITGDGTGTQSINITDFVSNATATLADGEQTISVGATLNLVANQTPGVYTGAAPFTVTVSYN